MVAQGALGFKYEEEPTKSGMTSYAGLPVYLDLAFVMGLSRSIKRHVGVRRYGQGWTDAQAVMSLILLNLVGGDSVDDLRILEADDGFARLLRRVELQDLPRAERRAVAGRWRKERKRSVPSPSAMRRYLSEFHDASEEERRGEGPPAFIPKPTEGLQGLGRVLADVISFVQRRSPESVATVDLDATLVESHKEEALYCYKKFKAYQPLNAYWAEQQVVIFSQFRDGNVPAGYQNLEVFQEALGQLPDGVQEVYLRTDTAGYEQDLLRYCEESKNERFGRIEFAVGVDVTPVFKEAVSQVAAREWRPLYREVKGELKETGQEWAEVCYVPNWVARGPKKSTYRYLAIREALRQQELPSLEVQQELPFPTMEFSGQGRFKLFGVVTNRDLPGVQLIWWHRERCGKSEEVHGVMKEDLAGSKLPSGQFGANAAWWAIMILALNLLSAMKTLVLGGSWTTKRLKAIRFKLINLPGRVMKRANELRIRLTAGHPSLDTLLAARAAIVALANAPPG